MPRQYSADASLRRDSRATGCSTPSSSSTPTTARRRSSRRSASSEAAIAAISASSAALLLAGVQRGERGAQVLVVLEPQPGGQALGRERAGELGEDRQRVVALAALGEDARERDAGVGAARLELERAAQVLLAAGLDERVGLGGQQRVEEARHHRGRLRAGELGLDAGRP